jgi:hypothetical protein
MSDAVQPQSLRDDIAFMRALAVEGQNNQSRGEIGLAAGLIWGSASLYDWAVWSKLISPIGDFSSFGWIWPAAAVVFLAVGFPLGMFRRSGNRALGAAWGSVGAACWTITAVIGLAAWRMNQGWIIFTLLPPIVMALYGGAWLLSATVMRKWWMCGVGVGCLLSGLVLAYFIAKPLEYLLFALALYLFAGVPGLLCLLRQRRAAERAA